jgi:hypothetical protein
MKKFLAVLVAALMVFSVMSFDLFFCTFTVLS